MRMNTKKKEKTRRETTAIKVREDAGDYLSARQRCLALFKRTRCRSVRFPWSWPGAEEFCRLILEQEFEHSQPE
jgi:hypothetical protein